VAFVLDASTVVAWALGETDTRAAHAVELIRSTEAVVPTLWWFELRNALVVNERRGRLTEHESTVFLQRVAQLSIVMDRSPDDARVMGLARKHRLTVYDAAYLELSLREAIPLATLDNPLADAARTEGVRLVGSP